MNAIAPAAEAPTLDVDPYAIDTLLAPYDLHEQLREAGPVVRLSRHGNYAVARYDEVKAVLSDWETFCSGYGAGLSDIRDPGSWRQPGPIVEADPPAHSQVRGVLSKIISPRIVRSWQIAFDTESATLVEEVCQTGEIDAARDISEAYVLKVFPEALGIEPNRENMVIVGDYNFNALGPRNALFEASAKALEGIADWLAAARGRDNIQAGSFCDQVYQAEDAGELAEGVASGLILSMYRGGTDTTISGISSALRLLSERPALWAKLRTDRSRLKMVFEEAIRLETPIQSYFRTTTRDVEFAGVTIPQDSKVQVFPGSANRDPRKWTDPASFDVQRPMAGHVAFGFGIHQCIGQMIARMEAESILAAMLDRIERLEPAGIPAYRPLNMLRTLDQLPLRLVPA